MEMKNYSNFEDGTGKVEYRRYQKRPGETGPLKLKHFGWSVDAQDHLRLACDAILAEIEDEVVQFYHTEQDKTTKAKKKFCRGARGPLGGREGWPFKRGNVGGALMELFPPCA